MTEGFPIKVHEDGTRYIEVPANMVFGGDIIRAHGAWRVVQDRQDGESEFLHIERCVFTFRGNDSIETHTPPDSVIKLMVT